MSKMLPGATWPLAPKFFAHSLGSLWRWRILLAYHITLDHSAIISLRCIQGKRPLQEEQPPPPDAARPSGHTAAEDETAASFVEPQQQQQQSDEDLAAMVAADAGTALAMLARAEARAGGVAQRIGRSHSLVAALEGQAANITAQLPQMQASPPALTPFFSLTYQGYGDIAAPSKGCDKVTHVRGIATLYDCFFPHL